jgi:hypothetical protein
MSANLQAYQQELNMEDDKESYLIIASMDYVVDALDDLARAYRKACGLDGAYDLELRKAEILIEAWREAKKVT